MNQRAERILWIISAVCQLYFGSYSATSLYLALTLTLPEYCSGDLALQQGLTFLLWFIFINMMGNFFCIIYTSKFSIVKPPPNAAKDLADLRISSLYQGHLYPSLSSTYSDINVGQSNTPLNNNLGDAQSSAKFAQADGERGNSAICNSLVNNGVIAGNGYQSNAESVGVELLGGWQRCKDCFALTPPRGKHCPLCKHCVLKRDHHCYFVGHCIGFHNQRFFVCFCLYGGLGGLYSMWMTSHYLQIHYLALQAWGWLAYMGPFALIHWALGYTSAPVMGLVMFWWWSFITSAMGCCYCFSQILLVIRGQTKWEFFQDKFPYRGKLMDNVQSVFGKFWPLCFLIPAPFLGYVGDGANWDDLIDSLKSL